MRKFYGFLLAAMVCVFLLPSAASAQFENGSIVGTIRDGSGAVVSGATVTVTSVGTGIVSTRTTNDSGDYEVPELRVGQYDVVVTKTGFAQARATDITVSVAARQRIDLTLKVGDTVTTVEVTGISLQLETDTSQRGQIITQHQSAALPLVSRNYSDLLGLVTGVRQAPTAATTSSISSLVRAGAYNVNGQRSMFNNFLLDGMDNNAYGESNQGFDNQIIAIPPDSVAQFSVVTNNESAEYGRSSGATINTASAGGTNRFHGLVYEFIRNTDLNAAGFFKPNVVSNTGTVIPFQKPTFNRNQFGMNFGGPILRDKLFFFLDYEGFRQTLRPLSVLTLPTQNQLNGNLVVAVRDPLTGTIYPAGTPIPQSAINPLSQQIISAFKQIPGLPASGVPSTGLASNSYAVQAPFTDNADKGDLRLDYQQNQNNSWFLRISDRKENAVNYPTIPLPLDGQTNGKIRVLDQQIALGYTHLIGANKIIDARLGLSRTKAGKYTLSIGDNSIAIPGLPSDPVVAGGLPSIGISGFTGFGRQSTNPQWQNPSLVDPRVNFTWAHAKHSLKFGYEYEHIWMAVNDNNPLYGSFTYNGGYSVCPGSGGKPALANCTNTSAVSDNYWADFLFGTTNAYSLANYFVAHLRQTIQSVYAQDDWRVTPKLTLNLGLRWEYGSPYSEQNNQISNFDPVSQSVLTITPGAIAGNGITPFRGSGVYGRTLVNPDLNDFAPRIGFAYAPLPNTAIRGGYGISYVHYTRAGSGDILAINAPQALFVSVPQNAPSTTNQCPSGAPSTSCYVTADQGFPATLSTTFNPATDNITWIPKDTRDSYVQNYYISVQRELSKNILLDIAYVGNHGLKLQGFLNANQKNPSEAFARPFSNWPSDITTALNGFYSNYNALQARYEQRMVAGLTLLNSFTWSHALDNASASLEGNTPSPQDANNLRADYAQSDYNLPVSNVASLVYDLPIGHGRRFLSDSNGVVNSLAGGWQISVINTAQAGTPFNLTYSPNSANSLSPQISATYRGANEYRPNIVPGQKVTQGRSSRAANTGYVNYVNYNAFVLPPTKDAAGNLLSPFGNASRNPGRTPAFNETDISLNKRFNTPIETLKVEFRSEFYNIFNQTNLYLPNTIGGTLGTTSQVLGVGATAPASAITGGVPTTGGQITSTFEPRIIQFGLKIMF
jgi:Carboxypeptidase regulatory-like domain/TonB dependent receptor/TonB-dependent Receptor Plug Domain